MEKVVTAAGLRSFYKDKKVFVTGHTGFKGSWLCAWLSQLGASVKGYALAPEYEDCLYNLLQPTGIMQSVIADIRDKDRLKKELLEFAPDFIFHLAAQPLVRRSYQVPAETFEVNVVGTANLLEAAKELNGPCSIIVITTDKVYENKEQHIRYNESDILGGYDPYSASKACTEIVVSSFRNSFFNPAAISVHQKALVSVRAGNVIGGGDYSTDRIIPDIVRALEAGKPVEVRNPNSIRPWQHVLEPLGGYLLLGGLLQKEPLKYSGAYNFGPVEEGHLVVKELVDIAIRCWGSGEWIDRSDPAQPHEAALLKLDISKAEQVLNWHPHLTAAQAIEWTINWYRQQPEDRLSFTYGQVKDYMRS